MKETKIKITCDLCGKEIVCEKEEELNDVMSNTFELLFGAPKDFVNKNISASITFSYRGKDYKTLDICPDCASKIDIAIDTIEKEKQNERQ